MGNRATGVLAVAALAMVSGAAGAATPAAGCNPDGELRYLCGPANAEDMVRLGETRWLVTSGMDGPLMGGGPARGHLYLVDHQAKTFVDWFPGQAGPAKHDKSLFGSCPGPVDPTRFSAHGLSLKEQAAGRYRLYVTAHGAREAVEVFDIDASGARPTVAWVGCVVLPDDVMANGVAMLPDGGFVVTKFLDRGQPEAQAFAATDLLIEETTHPQEHRRQDRGKQRIRQRCGGTGDIHSRQPEQGRSRAVFERDEPAQDQARNQTAERELVRQDEFLEIREDQPDQQGCKQTRLPRDGGGAELPHRHREGNPRQQLDRWIAHRDGAATLPAASSQQREADQWNVVIPGDGGLALRAE